VHLWEVDQDTILVGELQKCNSRVQSAHEDCNIASDIHA
jgi:hypothetical protein